MPHSHGVDNCSLRLCRKGRQLDLGESRSPTQFSERNLRPVSCRFRVYVCAFEPGLMVTVPKALTQVGWLRQCQYQSFNRLKAFYWPKLPETQSFPSAQSFPCRTLLLPNMLLHVRSRDLFSSVFLVSGQAGPLRNTG